jgi:hypothetical protein
MVSAGKRRNQLITRRWHNVHMLDTGFIHDIGAMGVIDWFRLGGLLFTMAITLCGWDGSGLRQGGEKWRRRLAGIRIFELHGSSL